MNELNFSAKAGDRGGGKGANGGRKMGEQHPECRPHHRESRRIREHPRRVRRGGDSVLDTGSKFVGVGLSTQHLEKLTPELPILILCQEMLPDPLPLRAESVNDKD